MGEWASYRLQDFLLFAPQTYYRLFEIHNAALWPLQWLLLALGVLIAGLASAGHRVSSPPARRYGPPLSLALLAIAWAIVGVGFHWRRYADINWAAHWFGAAFLAQAGLLLAAALARSLVAPADGALRRETHATGIGAALVGFALLLQPWLGLLLGRSWRQAEWFGMAPDPTVLFTLGVLLMLQWPHSRSSVQRWLLRACWPIPLAWSVVGGATLAAMESPLAWLLPSAALLAVITAVCARSVRRSS
jgi:hypothetical protein